jgi:hypothetical protein
MVSVALNKRSHGIDRGRCAVEDSRLVHDKHAKTVVDRKHDRIRWIVARPAGVASHGSAHLRSEELHPVGNRRTHNREIIVIAESAPFPSFAIKSAAWGVGGTAKSDLPDPVGDVHCVN